MRRIISLILVLSGSACSREPTFVPADLSKIALQPSEAPQETRYWEETSGPQGKEIFAGDPRAAREAIASGWQAGYASIFVQEGYALGDQEQAPSDALFVGSYLWMFEEAEEASADLKEYVSGYTKESGMKRLNTEGVDDDAFGGRGKYGKDEGGQPWLVYAWRVRNLNLLSRFRDRSVSPVLGRSHKGSTRERLADGDPSVSRAPHGVSPHHPAPMNRQVQRFAIS